MKTNTERIDHEPIWKLFGKTCIQATFSLFVYSAYSFTDTWVVAKWAGVMASAGIGILSPIFFILSGISTTIGTGAASMLSRALGENKPERSAGIVANMAVLFLCCTVIFTVLGEVLLPWVLKLQGARGEIYTAALAYGRILIAGAVTSTGFSSVMRAAGHLKYATLQWMVPIIVNLGFDILLVCGLGMGVRGAAWATILSQIVSSITSLYYFLIYKKKPYLITRKSICIDKSIMREIAAVGCPSLFQQAGNSIAAIVFQTLVISAGSGVVYAAYVIVNQIMQIFWTPHTGIAQGAQPLIGYFCGSGDTGKKERVIHGAVLISVLYGIGSMAICTGIFESAFVLFANEASLIKYGKEIFGFLIFIFPIKGVGTILLTVLQAEGKTGKAWLLSIISICAIQLPCLFWGKRLWGVKGLWIAMIAAECIYVICAVVLVRREKIYGKYNKEQETQGRY